MAIIELNLEKPALKRVESGEQTSRTTATQSESGSDAESNRQSSYRPVGSTARPKTGSRDRSSDESSADSSDEGSSDQSGGTSRIRKYGRRMVVLGGTAAGVAAARKLRQRRKSDAGQQELEDDWQTAEPTSSASDASESSTNR